MNLSLATFEVQGIFSTFYLTQDSLFAMDRNGEVIGLAARNASMLWRRFLFRAVDRGSFV
jgi:hypothetical protein